MAKEWAKPFYNSKQWKQCRKSYIAHRISIDGGMCEHCHRELGYIDHITELQDLGRMQEKKHNKQNVNLFLLTSNNLVPT